MRPYARQGSGIDSIGLGTCPAGFGEPTHLEGINLQQRKPGRKGFLKRPMIWPGRLECDPSDECHIQPLNQRPKTAPRVLETFGFPVLQAKHIEVEF